MTRVLRFLVLSFLTLSAGVVHAVVEQTFRFTSEPAGCQVVMKQGLKEIDLGTTPLNANIRFRSQSSVVRVAIRKPGYQETIIKVSPDRSEVHVRLAAESYFIDGTTYKSAALVKIQEKMEKPVNQYLASDLSKTKRYTHNDKIYLQKTDDVVSVVFNLQAASRPPNLNQDELKKTSEETWKDLSNTFAKTINHVLRVGDVNSLLFNVATARERLQAGSPIVRRVTKMKWVGGYVYNPVTGANDYNPFHHQVPVVIENIEQGGLEKSIDHSMLVYEITTDEAPGNITEFPYEKIKVRKYDKRGKLVFSRN